MPYKVFVCSLTVDTASAGRMPPRFDKLDRVLYCRRYAPGSSYVPPFELSDIALTFGFKWIVTTSVALDHATLWLWMCRCQPVCNSRGGKAEGGFCGAYARMLLIILVCWCLKCSPSPFMFLKGVAWICCAMLIRIDVVYEGLTIGCCM